MESSLLNELRSLEERLATPEVRRSRQEMSALIADDFREFGSSGRVYDKEQILDALQTERPCQLWLREFQATSLGPDAALLTYYASRQFAGPDAISHSSRSSIWRKENGKWRIVFHQGSPWREEGSVSQG